MKTFLLALALALFLPATTFADVDCSDVRNKNQDECVQAKRRNNNSNDRDININCSDVRNQNRDECVRAKSDNRRDNINKDDVECRNADDSDVRRECLKRKY
jgi:hypothetical protein